MVSVVSGVWPGESDFRQELEAAGHRDGWLTIVDVRFGSRPVNRRCHLNVRFARQRTRGSRFSLPPLPYGKPSPRRQLKPYAAILATRGAARPMSSTKRAALYVRISTHLEKVKNQNRELRPVARRRRGCNVVEVYSDAGLSGAKGRNGRPGLDTMPKDASRRKFDIVMAWAIDRLGRSL